MKRDWLATARTLSEALPYLQRYDGKTVVVKFGGHAMGDATSLSNFARDIVLMKQCGVHPVVVHGGGPQINQMLDRLGVVSEFKDGLRVTTEETVEVVEMVLAGRINKSIVAAINAQGGQAVGLSGKDANLIVCKKALKTKKDPESHIEQVLDLGWVGEPVDVNPRVLRTFIDSDFIPVVAPVGAGQTPEETFNINGDTAARRHRGRHGGRAPDAADGCAGRHGQGKTCSDRAHPRRCRHPDGRRHHRGRHDPQGRDSAGRHGRGLRRRGDSGRTPTPRLCCWSYSPNTAPGR